jgi:arginyl-tRNA synthetase
VISSDVRRAIGRAVAAAGLEPADPRLRPTGTSGQYASSVAFAFGEPPERVAARLAALLAGTEPVGRAEVTGPGFITITVRPEALAHLPERIIAAGPACATSDALHGLTVPAPPPADPLAAPGWEEARTALAAQLTARLAAAAGATAAAQRTGERSRGSTSHPDDGQTAADVAGDVAADVAGDVAAAVAFAGADPVRFSLARAVPGRPAAIDPLIIARQVIDNPAYAVRYAHSRAASELRWAAGSGETATLRWAAGSGETATLSRDAVPWRSSAGQGDLLLDALSWLPEWVASAARRGRPDEFARHLEELASATIATLIGGASPGSAPVPEADRLGLAGAARTGLAAGLGLLGISAPDRL